MAVTETMRSAPRGGNIDCSEIADYRFHDVYTDGRYVYDPAMSLNPIPYGDHERAIRLMNPVEKLLIGDGGYKGPLY